MHNPNKTYFKLFIFILFLVLFGLGCANLPSSSSSTPVDSESDTEPADAPTDATSTATSLPSEPTTTEPPAPDEPTTGPPEAPTRPPPVIDPSAAIPHLTPGQDVIISYIDMQDAASGWAVGGASNPSGHILRTSDGGITWQDVTPPEPDSEQGESRKIAKAFFLDANNAWVTFSFSDFFIIPGDVIVWRTSDGGNTWTPSNYLDSRGSAETYAPTFLHFVDANNGWFLVTVGAGMSHNYTFFYRTTDGGATWSKIADPTNSEYMQGCCKTGMAFADANTGITTYGQGPYESVYVSWTLDGGLTWIFSPLPSPASQPGIFENDFCESHSPTFFSPLSVTIGVTCRAAGGDSPVIDSHFVFSTTDGGATWLGYRYGGGKLLFVDTNIVYDLSEDISRSTDGGMTWKFVKTVIWQGQFSFASDMVGWAVARDDAEIALVMTNDGGSTWMILEPVIGP